MSDKCKILMRSEFASYVDAEDGVLWEEFCAAAPPMNEFDDLGIWHLPRATDEMVYVVTNAADDCRHARDVSCRLAAIVHVEIATGPPAIVHCSRALRAAWQAIWKAVVDQRPAWQGGTLVAETATTATFEFASALAAVRWSIGVQSLNEAQADEALAAGLRLRISIGVGEIHDAARCLEGRGLNDPAFISHLGCPGGILTTQTVLDLIRYDLRPEVTSIDVPADDPMDASAALYALNWQSS
ncbi:MAG: hypothetical protein JXQ99_12925 [Hyphomicrobiaceae bacterium]